MPRILLIDNVDSFVHNIAQLLREAGAPFDIARNSAIPFDRLGDYTGIILSPGPGLPEEAGDLLKLLSVARQTHPILGICLGHQALAQSFGARLKNIPPCHGLRTPILPVNGGDLLFDGIPEKDLHGGRYHSWVIDPETVPEALIVTSLSPEGHIMSLRHRTRPLRSVQFHPESFMTANGARMLKNWLSILP